MSLLEKIFGKKTPKETIQEKSENQESDNYFSNQVDRNLKGKEYEKKGEIEFAIREYEENLKEKFGGSHPYNRLAIIYRKNKDYDNEIRVLNSAIEIYTERSESSPRAYVDPKLNKFRERLKKALEFKNVR
jgi:tetratricopeptide (TPR) repeat protein